MTVTFGKINVHGQEMGLLFICGAFSTIRKDFVMVYYLESIP